MAGYVSPYLSDRHTLLLRSRPDRMPKQASMPVNGRYIALIWCVSQDFGDRSPAAVVLPRPKRESRRLRTADCLDRQPSGQYLLCRKQRNVLKICKDAPWNQDGPPGSKTWSIPIFLEPGSDPGFSEQSRNGDLTRSILPGGVISRQDKAWSAQSLRE